MDNKNISAYRLKISQFIDDNKESLTALEIDSYLKELEFRVRKNCADYYSKLLVDKYKNTRIIRNKKRRIQLHKFINDVCNEKDQYKNKK